MDVSITGLETPSPRNMRTTRDPFTPLHAEQIKKLEEKLFLLVVTIRLLLSTSLMASFQSYGKLVLMLLQDLSIFIMDKF